MDAKCLVQGLAAVLLIFLSNINSTLDSLDGEEMKGLEESKMTVKLLARKRSRLGPLGTWCVGWLG